MRLIRCCTKVSLFLDARDSTMVAARPPQRGMKTGQSGRRLREPLAREGRPRSGAFECAWKELQCLGKWQPACRVERVAMDGENRPVTVQVPQLFRFSECRCEQP